MALRVNGIGQTTWVGVSAAALLGLTGCGGPGVTENAMPTASGSGSTSQPGLTNPSATNPSATNPSATNPSATTPPVVELAGEAVVAHPNGTVLTTTRTNTYSLVSGGLSSGGWQNTALLETGGTHASSPRVVYDSSGNGFATWVIGSDIFVRRYVASSATWSPAVVLDSSAETASQSRIAVDRATGNAIAAWAQSDGVAVSLFVSRYNVATNTWSAPQQIDTSNNPVSNAPENSVVAINGTHAAVAWRQLNGTTGSIYSIYLSRFENGAWTAPVLIDGTNEDALHPEVAVDTNGNVALAWRQRDALQGEYRIHYRRWYNATQTLGAIQQLDNNGDRQPRLQFDAQGNGFLLWRGGGIWARRYDAASDSWGPEVAIHNLTADAWGGELSVDAAGNAMAAWIENDGTANSAYARRFSAATGTWGPSQLLENSSVPASIDLNPTVSLNGGEAIVAWIQGTTTSDVYAARLSNGTWSAARLMESRSESAQELTSTIDPAGNSALLWIQGDGGARSVYEARYLSSNYVVPNGATWQSIANSLYGVNAPEAGTALQAAMGGVTLTPGMLLSGFPANLVVTTTVQGFYTVRSNDDWSHITKLVYGTDDVNAIARLQALLGNPTLSTGLQITMPTNLDYITSDSYSAPLDWSLVNTTSTAHYNLNSGVLTVPLNDWATAGLLENSNLAVTSQRVAFDAAGNGIVAWTQGNDIFVRRYIAANGSWSAAITLDGTNNNAAHTARVALDRATGNAVVAWTQSDGVAESVYTSSFNAAANTWTAAALLETSNNAVVNSSEALFVAKTGNYAAAAWLQSDGTVNNVYLSRQVNGTWTAPVVVDTDANPALHPEVAIDSNGNAGLVWRQYSNADFEYRIRTRRWDNVTQSFSAVTAIDGDGDRQPRIRFDAQGSGMALWRGGGVYASHYNVATNTWSAPVSLHTGTNGALNGELAVDASGDALATWIQNDGSVYSVYARHYDAHTGTWGAPTLLENLTTPANDELDPTVSLVDGAGVVAWIHNNGTQDLYAARVFDGVWGTAQLLESRSEGAQQPFSSIDASYNATVTWLQPDGAAPGLYQARSNGTPYYSIPAGATWQSIANTLYGVNSAEAGAALQTAMNNAPLTSGARLSNLPAVLTVNPAVPTYYVVRSGDTWASVTLALYGTNRPAAATTLQSQLGNPALTVGSWLIVPVNLNYTAP